MHSSEPAISTLVGVVVAGSPVVASFGGEAEGAALAAAAETCVAA